MSTDGLIAVSALLVITVLLVYCGSQARLVEILRADNKKLRAQVNVLIDVQLAGWQTPQASGAISENLSEQAQKILDNKGINGMENQLETKDVVRVNSEGADGAESVRVERLPVVHQEPMHQEPMPAEVPASNQNESEVKP